MKLTVVGSGSSGNTYILSNEQEAIILDAGMPFLEVKKALKFRIKPIKAVFVTHVHEDHAKYAKEYEKAGIPVIRSYTVENMRSDIRAGGFRVRSVPMVHDVPCAGYLIEHPELGKMLYATDTAYIRYRFRGLNIALVEANYSDEFADRDEPKYRHVLSGHMSINTCVDFINSNVDGLKHVILCHLSQQAADPEMFRNAVESIVPGGCKVDIAEKGAVIELNA